MSKKTSFQLLQGRAYRVKVEPTNAVADAFTDDDGEYYDCEDGRIFVVTSDPRAIYSVFGKRHVEAVRDAGVAYYIGAASEEDEDAQ